MARLPRTGRIVAIVVALALAVAAVFFINRYVNSVEDQVRADQELVEVYVATGPIAEGTFGDTAISQGLIERDEYPRANRPEGAITQLEQISGLAVVHPILAGEVVLQGRFGDPASAAVEFEVPEGLQAISLQVDVPAGVAGFVQAGDQVSIIAHIEGAETGAPVIGPDGTLVQPDTPEDGPEATRAQFLVQGAEVLAVGRRVIVTDEQGQETDQVQQTEQILVTVAVSDQRAEKLVFAVQEGLLYFTLLPEDYEPQDTPGRTFEDLFGPES